MNASSHPTVVEYAVHECFKHKTPQTAARITAKKLGGSKNLFVGGGLEELEIDAQELENQVWLRIAERAVKAQASVKPGFEEWILGGVLQDFGQKDTPKNREQLRVAMEYLKALD